MEKYLRDTIKNGFNIINKCRLAYSRIYMKLEVWKTIPTIDSSQVLTQGGYPVLLIRLVHFWLGKQQKRHVTCPKRQQSDHGQYSSISVQQNKVSWGTKSFPSDKSNLPAINVTLQSSNCPSSGSLESLIETFFRKICHTLLHILVNTSLNAHTWCGDIFNTVCDSREVVESGDSWTQVLLQLCAWHKEDMRRRLSSAHFSHPSRHRILMIWFTTFAAFGRYDDRCCHFTLVPNGMHIALRARAGWGR